MRLLSIESADQLVTHPLRGALFENWVIAELLKGRGARGKSDNLYFWRSHVGHEVDIIAEHADRLMPVEIKSGAAIASDWFASLHSWLDMAGPVAQNPTLVCGGDRRQSRSGLDILPWQEINALTETV